MSNRRAYPRLDAAIDVRLIINDQHSAVGVAANLSAGGVAVISDAPANIGDRIVIYFSGGARLEGAIARHIRDGFAVSFSMGKIKRNKLTQLLDPIYARGARLIALPADRRLGKRFGALNANVSVETRAGLVDCEILDLSLSGVGIRTKAALVIGDKVKIGQMKGRIIRREGENFGVVFEGFERSSVDRETARLKMNTASRIARSP